MLSSQDLLHAWSTKVDPRTYLYEIYNHRSEMLLKIFKKYEFPKDSSILEIGCNAGRNLKFLYDNGYENLVGIEPCQHACELLIKTFGNICNLYNGPIENIIKELPDFDIIFTMAVLNHLHTDLDWIHELIADKCKILITIENEVTDDGKIYFPRNMQNTFKQLHQVESFPYMLDQNEYIVRIFNHASQEEN